MAIPGWKSGAALIAGCPFVLKPSSLTPLSAAKFVEVLDEAGFPPGVVNMLTGSGSVVGDALVAHPDIRVISFTGGVDTGRHVYESAAKKMIKVGLELGARTRLSRWTTPTSTSSWMASCLAPSERRDNVAPPRRV